MLQTTFRCSEVERDSYHEAAKRDGFERTAEWMRAVLNEGAALGYGARLAAGEKAPFPGTKPELFLLRGVLLMWEAVKLGIERGQSPEDIDLIRNRAQEFLDRLVPGSRDGV